VSVLPLTELDTVGSTNDHAKDMARAGAPAGSIVLARVQTAGRGRQGRSWSSLSGNLHMSLVLRPCLSLRDRGQLSFAAGVGLAEAVELLLPQGNKLALKWPNDMLIDDKKAAGILIETEGDFAIIGIGLNLLHAPLDAVSLQGLGMSPPRTRDLAMDIAARVMAQANSLDSSGFGSVRENWLKRAWRLYLPISARVSAETLQGTFLGIDASGALQLQTGEGVIRSIPSAEILSS
jgi:BirA family biotin operon repressor/biotin-[acetyl-CoA-carboxylase] ligase